MVNPTPSTSAHKLYNEFAQARKKLTGLMIASLVGAAASAAITVYVFSRSNAVCNSDVLSLVCKSPNVRAPQHAPTLTLA